MVIQKQPLRGSVKQRADGPLREHSTAQ